MWSLDFQHRGEATGIWKCKTGEQPSLINDFLKRCSGGLHCGEWAVGEWKNGDRHNMATLTVCGVRRLRWRCEQVEGMGCISEVELQVLANGTDVGRKG